MNPQYQNKKSKIVFASIGASNHSEGERQKNDFYATDPKAVSLLCKIEKFNKNIWECACGNGSISKELIINGYDVYSTDLINRGYGEPNVDFLNCNKKWNGDIITNPPYKYAYDFIRRSLSLIETDARIAMFLKIQFLEGRTRKKLFLENPPQVVYVSSSRLLCAKNGEFGHSIANGKSAIAYGWFIWKKGYKGDTILKWFN